MLLLIDYFLAIDGLVETNVFNALTAFLRGVRRSTPSWEGLELYKGNVCLIFYGAYP